MYCFVFLLVLSDDAYFVHDLDVSFASLSTADDHTHLYWLHSILLFESVSFVIAASILICCLQYGIHDGIDCRWDRVLPSIDRDMKTLAVHVRAFGGVVGAICHRKGRNRSVSMTILKLNVFSTAQALTLF